MLPTTNALRRTTMRSVSVVVVVEAVVVVAVEAVSVAAAALSVVGQVAHLPKIATPRTARIVPPTVEPVGTTHCRDDLMSTTIERTHSIASKLPPIRFSQRLARQSRAQQN